MKMRFWAFLTAMMMILMASAGLAESTPDDAASP